MHGFATLAWFPWCTHLAADCGRRALGGKHAVVVGGGNSAGQAAVHLARYAEQVSIVVRRTGLVETMSDYLITEITANPRIRIVARPRSVTAAAMDVSNG